MCNRRGVTEKRRSDNVAVHSLLLAYSTHMNRTVQDILRRAGLSADELRLYRILSRGSSTIPDLMTVLKMPSSTTYRALHSLQKRGLVEGDALNRKQKVFSALPPAVLARQLASSRRSLRRMELALCGFDHWPLPTEESGGKEPVEILETPEEIREHYFAIPRWHREDNGLLSFGSMDDLYAMMGFSYGSEEENHFIHERIRHALHICILCHASKFFSEMSRRDHLEKRTMRTSPSIPAMKNFFVVGQEGVSIFLTSDTQPRVLRIRQPELIAEYRQRFAQYWERSEKGYSKA